MVENYDPNEDWFSPEKVKERLMDQLVRDSKSDILSQAIKEKGLEAFIESRLKSKDKRSLIDPEEAKSYILENSEKARMKDDEYQKTVKPTDDFIKQINETNEDHDKQGGWSFFGKKEQKEKESTYLVEVDDLVRGEGVRTVKKTVEMTETERAKYLLDETRKKLEEIRNKNGLSFIVSMPKKPWGVFKRGTTKVELEAYAKELSRVAEEINKNTKSVIAGDLKKMLLQLGAVVVDGATVDAALEAGEKVLELAEKGAEIVGDALEGLQEDLAWVKTDGDYTTKDIGKIIKDNFDGKQLKKTGGFLSANNEQMLEWVIEYLVEDRDNKIKVEKVINEFKKEKDPGQLREKLKNAKKELEEKKKKK